MADGTPINESHTAPTLISIGFAVAIVLVAVILRVVSRLWRKLALSWDDYFIFAGAAFALVEILLDVWGVQNGAGRHMDTLSEKEVKNVSLWFYISEQFYAWSVTMIKLSVLMLYRRIFSVRSYLIPTSILIFLVVCWVLIVTFLQAFQCTPAAAAYNPYVKGTCFNPMTINIGLQVPNVVLDALILALPLTAVSRLHVPGRRKTILVLVFGVGILTLAFATTRLAIVITEGQSSKDYTYATAKFVWANIEVSVGVFAACLPTYAPLLLVKDKVSQSLIALRSLITSSRRSNSTASDGDMGAVLPGGPANWDKTGAGLPSGKGYVESGGTSVDQGLGEDKIGVRSEITCEREKV